VERVVDNALALAAAGSPADICAAGVPAGMVLRTRRSTFAGRVDISTPEFSLAIRHASGRCGCKLWQQNEDLRLENDFDVRASIQR
jgi:hypothetical protein